jgi:hypothetical protein
MVCRYFNPPQASLKKYLIVVVCRASPLSCRLVVSPIAVVVPTVDLLPLAVVPPVSVVVSHCHVACRLRFAESSCRSSPSSCRLSLCCPLPSSCRMSPCCPVPSLCRLSSCRPSLVLLVALLTLTVVVSRVVIVVPPVAVLPLAVVVPPITVIVPSRRVTCCLVLQSNHVYSKKY